MSIRIYKVTVNKEEKLVKASTRAQAFRGAANSLVKAELATQEDCIRLAANGLLDLTQQTAPAEAKKEEKQEQKPETKKAAKTKGSSSPSNMKKTAAEPVAA